MTQMNIKKNNKWACPAKRGCCGGFSVIETIFYIALFAILSIAVINAMITMTKAFRETALHTELIQSGIIMEKISREVKQALSIDTISATNLKLNTKDDAGADKTVEFVISGSNIRFLENNVFTGNLNTPNIVVSNLSFTQITTAKGTAVKISFTIRSTRDSLNRTYDFYDTVVLRGDY